MIYLRIIFYIKSLNFSPKQCVLGFVFKTKFLRNSPFMNEPLYFENNEKYKALLKLNELRIAQLDT